MQVFAPRSRRDRRGRSSVATIDHACGSGSAEEAQRSRLGRRHSALPHRIRAGPAVAVSAGSSTPAREARYCVPRGRRPGTRAASSSPPSPGTIGRRQLADAGSARVLGSRRARRNARTRRPRRLVLARPFSNLPIGRLVRLRGPPVPILRLSIGTERMRFAAAPAPRRPASSRRGAHPARSRARPRAAPARDTLVSSRARPTLRSAVSR